jgi:hypothetical protein
MGNNQIEIKYSAFVKTRCNFDEELHVEGSKLPVE